MSLPFEAAGEELAERWFEAADRAWDLRDDAAAFRLFQKGAEAGNVSCQLNAGYCLDAGKGVERDEQAALRWYHEAHRQGCGSAASNIGTVWRDHDDVPRALWWFHRALALGDGDALLEIGRLHEKTGRLHLAERTYLRAPDQEFMSEHSRVSCRWGLRRVRRRVAGVSSPPGTG